MRVTSFDLAEYIDGRALGSTGIGGGERTIGGGEGCLRYDLEQLAADRAAAGSGQWVVCKAIRRMALNKM
jgi:hypothetical protein